MLRWLNAVDQGGGRSHTGSSLPDLLIAAQARLERELANRSAREYINIKKKKPTPSPIEQRPARKKKMPGNAQPLV